MSKAEEQIRRAMEEGQFDNLPGKGKPLNLDENPYEDPEWRMAHHILHNSGFSLPWIETRREIETNLEAARTSIKTTWDWRKTALEGKQPIAFVEAEWERAVNAERDIERLIHE